MDKNQQLKERLSGVFGDHLLRVFEPLIYSGMEIVKWEKGDVQIKLPINKDMLNPNGVLHGGMTYTLCDMSTGLTAASIGASITTLQGSINYIKSAKEGYVITKNKIIHNGRSTKVANVEVINQDGDLIASGVFTMFVIGTYDVE